MGAPGYPGRGKNVTTSPQRNAHKYRTLLVSHDVLGEMMAGPGIRYYHLSRILSQYTDLTLAIRPQNEEALAELQARLPQTTVIEYTRGDWPSIKDEAELAEIIILGPYTTWEIPQFGTLDRFTIIDGYDPLLIEWLTTLSTEDIEQQMGQWADRAAALFYQYLNSDFFICASERQRYWWLGQLEVAGRINPLTYRADKSLRNLVDVVPYGLPEEPARHTKQVIKGIWPGIAADDFLLLWGGGLWPWLDPLTAVRAVARLHAEHPRLKLIFPGTIHPNPEIGRNMPVRNSEIYTFAEEEGLLNKTIFFGKWIPYDDWVNVLLESDAALSLHHDTAETQLAFRSRMLEYIWAGVPTIATRGDATSRLIRKYELGEIVGYEDVEGVVQAIRNIVGNGPASYQAGLAAARQELSWERAARPLIQFCQNPRRAPDRHGRRAGRVPYYERRLKRMERRVEEMERLVKGYESGRVMRLLNSLHRLRKRVLGAFSR